MSLLKRFLLVSAVVLFIVAAVGKVFVFEIPVMSGDGMAPALQAGDRLLVYKRFNDIRRGDLILFEHPEIEGRLLIRRVIGLPGETVGLERETPVVDKRRFTRKLLHPVTLARRGDLEIQMKLIRERIDGCSYDVLKDPVRRTHDAKPKALSDALFVMADNRNHSTGTPVFGPVARSLVRGIVTHRLSAGAGSIKPQPHRPSFTRIEACGGSR